MKKVKEAEVAPPGWEPTIKKMKQEPGIDNPWALAWWMQDQGMTPGGKESNTDLTRAWGEFQKCPKFSDYMKKYPMPAQECNSASSLAQLTRKPAQESAKPIKFNVQFREAGLPDVANREIPVYIISEGLGNKVDKHFYTKAALSESFPRFEGAKAFADHPSKSEEADRPERSVRDVVGYYHSAKYVEDAGLGKIKAMLKINKGPAFDWVWDLLTEAVAFQQKFPDKNYVGLSINATGITHPEEDENKDIIHFVDAIKEVNSADIVTQPGAGGKPLRESDLAGLGGTMKDKLMKAAEALKGVRGKMSEDDAAGKAYGPALDDILSQLSKLADECEGEVKKEDEKKEDEVKPGDKPLVLKKEEEMAPPPDKDGQLKPTDKKEDEGQLIHLPEGEKKSETEDEIYASEAERYRTGKMSDGERKLFEALTQKRAEIALIESDKMIEKKLKESGLPEKVTGDVRLICRGKDEKFVDEVIKARKDLMESLTGNRASGAGAKGGQNPSNELRESLAKAGVPLKS